MRRLFTILLPLSILLTLCSCHSETPVEKLISLGRELEQVNAVRTGVLSYEDERVQQAEARADAIREEMMKLIKDNEAYELTQKDRDLLLQFDEEQNGGKLTSKERRIILESRTLGGLFYGLKD